MKANVEPLRPGKIYHVFNRGINGENLFKEERNYDLFLKKYAEHVYPIAKIYTYCLMKNHFHLMVEIRSSEEIRKHFLKPGQDNSYTSKFIDDEAIGKFAGRQFGHLFNGYSQVINKTYARTGGLFEEPFRRIPVSTDTYFSALIGYIHFNPQKHGFVNDFKEYPFSSYQIHLLDMPTQLEREAVLKWFGGKDGYVRFHQGQWSESDLSELSLEM